MSICEKRQIKNILFAEKNIVKNVKKRVFSKIIKDVFNVSYIYGLTYID